MTSYCWRKIPKANKQRIYNNIVNSIISYKGEVWPFNEKGIRTLEATVMGFRVVQPENQNRKRRSKSTPAAHLRSNYMTSSLLIVRPLFFTKPQSWSLCFTNIVLGVHPTFLPIHKSSCSHCFIEHNLRIFPGFVAQYSIYYTQIAWSIRTFNWLKKRY